MATLTNEPMNSDESGDTLGANFPVGTGMKASERAQLRMQQTGEIYQAIGRFVVEFELLCHNLRTGITFCFGLAGLTNQQLANIVTAELTAGPLQSILRAMLGSVVELSDTDKAICDNIFKRAQAMTTVRNDVVHGTWFVGWGSAEDTDFSTASRHKPTRTKTGAGLKSGTFTAAQIEELAQQCAALKDAVMQLAFCVHGGFRLEKNFARDTDGNYVTP